MRAYPRCGRIKMDECYTFIFSNNLSLSLFYHMFTLGFFVFLLSISLLSKTCLRVRDFKSVSGIKKQRKY